MDWNAFEKEAKDLSQKITYHPDIIVGITRGGIVPARLLCTYLNVNDMYCISVKKEGEERKVVTEISDDLTGKNILLVEDMLETGKSFIIAKRYLESKGANVKTACLYVMSITKIKTDFSLRQVNEVQKFPWE